MKTIDTKITEMGADSNQQQREEGTITTSFQCYKRHFILGERAGEWEKTSSPIKYGENAIYAMLIDGSGYHINDVNNDLQYFVDMKK